MVFKMCEVSNDPDRVKQAMHNNMANVPVARGADKTHMDDFDENVEPPSGWSLRQMKHRTVKFQKICVTSWNL